AADRGAGGALHRLRCYAARFPRDGPGGLRRVLPELRRAPARAAATPARLHASHRTALHGRRSVARARSTSQSPRAPRPAAPCHRGGAVRARRRIARPAPGERMIDLSLLPDGGMSWLEASGPGSHLVVSTRVRLARNLQRHRFTTRNEPAERDAILGEVERAA